ncbi:MAG: hypothetical protein KatS3mg129_1578 [Leptospiraceae bacterium]|nr:MAG: hypothetical protein KatS3mg129_1578 [Leptospiraceae bacterium]
MQISIKQILFFIGFIMSKNKKNGNFMGDAKNVFLRDGILHIINESYSDNYIKENLKVLKAFRKGPYKINNIYIPSQWNSSIKWEYFLPIWENYIKNKLLQKNNINILDIGANNGYYSYLLYYELKKYNKNIQFYLIDPVKDFYNQFIFLKQFFPEEDQKNWHYEEIGWQEIKKYKSFDLILCMGILYHHTDPYYLLKTIHNLLVTSGILVLETITIDLNDYPLCLIPEKKYAGSSGIWFIPNKQAVFNFLKRSNYREIIFHNTRFLIEEMVQNDYLPGLKECLSEDKKTTIEGYPIPYRSFFTAIR